MKISILTLFPDMFSGPFDYSIVKRAQEKGIASVNIIDIRNFATDKYKSVDDHPYGGGIGMIMRVDVIDRALESQKSPPKADQPLAEKVKSQKCKTVLLDPRGETFTQQKAKDFSGLDHLILICGHYEGVDERVRKLVDESISIGDYVLTGGELPAMVITDSIVRLLPDVLKKEATSSESFSLEIGNWKLEIPVLEYPQYTRPPKYKNMHVPNILLSGDHRKIEEWKRLNTTTAKKGRASHQK